MPNATSYVVARAEPAHVSEVDVATPVASLAGEGLLGLSGGASIVVNDQTGPAVEPLVPFAVICQ